MKHKMTYTDGELYKDGNYSLLRPCYMPSTGLGTFTCIVSPVPSVVTGEDPDILASCPRTLST